MFSNKYIYNAENAMKAEEYIRYLNSNYSKDIEISSNTSTILTEQNTFLKRANNIETDVCFKNMNTIEALFKVELSGKTALLNFASFKEPGGAFLRGSMAQEEYLCHNSTLYPVLCNYLNLYYSINNTNKNKGLYFSKCIYSPNILFFHEDEKKSCDVITCSGPNWRVANRNGISIFENIRAVENRCEFIFKVASHMNVDNLILGAFGCGVFRQDAMIVSDIFSKLLSSNFYNVFSKVIFAVPGDY